MQKQKKTQKTEKSRPEAKAEKVPLNRFEIMDGYSYSELCKKAQKVERKDFKDIPEDYFPVYIRYTASDGAIERFILSNKDELVEWMSECDATDKRVFFLGCIPDKVEADKAVLALREAVANSFHAIEDTEALEDRYLRAAIVGYNWLLAELREAANSEDVGEEHAAYNAIVTRNPLKFSLDL